MITLHSVPQEKSKKKKIPHRINYYDDYYSYNATITISNNIYRLYLNGNLIDTATTGNSTPTYFYFGT